VTLYVPYRSLAAGRDVFKKEGVFIRTNTVEYLKTTTTKPPTLLTGKCESQ